ncbi:MAG: SprB repeat-containing protein [Chitinophagaceae bacterium]|nr:SprB repeat-containing protein [Chitinophagaceae bacterium]
MNAPNPCSGVIINITAATTNPTTGGGNNGSIAATASGGSSAFTYSLNGGPFQSPGTFSGLTAGNYNIAKMLKVARVQQILHWLIHVLVSQLMLPVP